MKSLKQKPILSTYYNTKMSKQVTLTLGERKTLIDVLNAFKGDLSTLSKILDDIKKVAITSDEWKVAELTKTSTFNLTKDGKTRNETIQSKEDQELLDYVAKMKKDGYEVEMTPNQFWNWQEKKEFEKEIELDNDVCMYVQNTIKDKEDKKEITMSDVSLITLKAKL